MAFHNLWFLLIIKKRILSSFSALNLISITFQLNSKWLIEYKKFVIFRFSEEYEWKSIDSLSRRHQQICDNMYGIFNGHKTASYGRGLWIRQIKTSHNFSKFQFYGPIVRIWNPSLLSGKSVTRETTKFDASVISSFIIYGVVVGQPFK